MPVDDIVLDTEIHMEKAVEHVQHELRAVRTGRASPALVEHLKVMYYEQLTDLRQIAMISVPEATQILIKPFVVQDLKAIEKAIGESKLGLTAHSDGKQLRLNLPPMSQERRQQLVVQCKGYAEQAKIAIRNSRRDANKLLESEHKGSLVTEDQLESGKEQIQELTKTYEGKIDELIEKKQKEVLAI